MENISMKRRANLDFFRGLLLVIITLDHFLAFNNIIRFFTYEFVGWVTAAEGFVFLSGLTTGLVYTYKSLEKGEKALYANSRKRAWIIYRNHALIFLLLFAVVFSGFAKNFWEKDYLFFTQKPALSVLYGLVLLYQPKYLDILPMYFVFMLFVPFIINWFHKGYKWYGLAISVALYLLGSINSYFHFTSNLTQGIGFKYWDFNLLCWQLLFFLGLLAGYLFYYGKTQKWQIDRRLFQVSICIATVLFIIKIMQIKYLGFNFDSFAVKSDLGPLRLLNFAVLAFIATYIASKRGNWFNAKPITYLGRHSLEVFSFHLLLIFFFTPVKEYLNTISFVKVTHSMYLYPLGSVFIVFCMVPALFFAPVLFGKATYVRTRNYAKD